MNASIDWFKVYPKFVCCVFLPNTSDIEEDLPKCALKKREQEFKKHRILMRHNARYGM